MRYNGFWRRFNMEKNFPEITGRKIVAYFNFDTVKESELVVKVALSAVSTEGAIKNLHAEASRKSFEELAEAARTDWNNELDHFEAEGTADQKAMLYTSLYHTMINPSVYMDVDGSLIVAWITISIRQKASPTTRYFHSGIPTVRNIRS